MLHPLVSVLIVSYNQVSFIRDAIESAATQDYENLEIIVADDGSTDGTVEIILECQKQYPGKLVALVGATNLGITGNSNRGLRACRGKYVAFMGGDDSFLPGKILAQVRWLEADLNRVLCYHDLDVYDSASNLTLYLWSERYIFRHGSARTVIRYGTFFGATSVMVRYPKGLLFNPNISTASDWLMWIEVLERQSGTLGHVDGVYARYRRHANNVTSTGKHHLADLLATIEAVNLLVPRKYHWERTQKLAEIYFLAAYRSFRAKEIANCLSLLSQSFRACKGFWISPVVLLFRKILKKKL